MMGTSEKVLDLQGVTEDWRRMKKLGVGIASREILVFFTIL